MTVSAVVNEDVFDKELDNFQPASGDKTNYFMPEYDFS